MKHYAQGRGLPREARWVTWGDEIHVVLRWCTDWQGTVHGEGLPEHMMIVLGTKHHHSRLQTSILQPDV